MRRMRRMRRLQLQLLPVVGIVPDLLIPVAFGRH
jgi:hypothetical protein